MITDKTALKYAKALKEWIEDKSNYCTTADCDGSCEKCDYYRKYVNIFDFDDMETILDGTIKDLKDLEGK